MAASWAPAPQVARLATQIMGHHHLHLAGAPIVYVFRDPPATSHGRLVLGKARRVTGLSAFLVALAAGQVDDREISDDVDDTFFVMEIALGPWSKATDEEREALVDHELSHFDIDPENGALRIRGHDIEEFTGVVERHGLWSPDVRRFAGVCSTVPT